MFILNTKNQVRNDQTGFGSSEDPVDPYDIDLVIDYELHNHNNHTNQPMSGGGGNDLGGGGGASSACNVC